VNSQDWPREALAVQKEWGEDNTAFDATRWGGLSRSRQGGETAEEQTIQKQPRPQEPGIENRNAKSLDESYDRGQKKPTKGAWATSEHSPSKNSKGNQIGANPKDAPPFKSPKKKKEKNLHGI